MKLLRRSSMQDLSETVLTESIGSDRVDTEAGVISGVKVLGKTSENGRDYSPNAMDDACRLYEGVEVNINHPSRSKVRAERGMSDGWGVLKACKVTASGVTADLHYLKEHSETPVLLERVSRGFPIGLSHNAQGKVSTRGRRPIVESIARVLSVDIVRRPATNTNIFEDVNEMATTTLREMIESTGYRYTHKLLEMLPDEVDPTAEVAAPEDAAGEPTEGAQAVVDTLAGEAAKIIADPAIDSAETIAKVKSIVKTVENVKKDLGPETAAPVAEEPATEPEGDETEEEKKKKAAMTESITEALYPLQESIKTLQLKVNTQSILEEYGIQASGLREDMRQALGKQRTEKGIRDLVESWPPAFRGASRPDFRPANNGKPSKHVPLFKMARR